MLLLEPGGNPHTLGEHRQKICTEKKDAEKTALTLESIKTIRQLIDTIQPTLIVK